MIDSVIDFVIESVIDSENDPVIDSEIDPVIDSVIDLNVIDSEIDPVIDSVIDLLIDTVTDSKIDPVIDSVIDLLTDTVIDSVNGPVIDYSEIYSAIDFVIDSSLLKSCWRLPQNRRGHSPWSCSRCYAQRHYVQQRLPHSLPLALFWSLLGSLGAPPSFSFHFSKEPAELTRTS